MVGSTQVTTATAVAQDILAKRMNAEGIDPDDVDCVAGAHPEGRKRGGTVSVLIAADNADVRVFFDEVAEEWFGYDEEDDE